MVKFTNCIKCTDEAPSIPSICEGCASGYGLNEERSACIRKIYHLNNFHYTFRIKFSFIKKNIFQYLFKSLCLTYYNLAAFENSKSLQYSHQLRQMH